MSFVWNEFCSYSPLNMHNTFKMVSNDENLRKWFKLELKFNAYSRLTILQNLHHHHFDLSFIQN